MNISNNILEIYNDKQKYDEQINSLMLDFMTKANELVEKSNDMYQIEHSIRLNEISLKDYILRSDFCVLLKQNNVVDYTIEELEQYMNNYEYQNSEFDMYKYKLALSLYKELEKIKQIIDKKIDMKVSRIENIINSINGIKNINNKGEYQNLFNKVNIEIKQKYIDTNIIDDTASNYINQIINDIFNYYIDGYKNILITS